MEYFLLVVDVVIQFQVASLKMQSYSWKTNFFIG